MLRLSIGLCLIPDVIHTSLVDCVGERITTVTKAEVQSCPLSTATLEHTHMRERCGELRRFLRGVIPKTQAATMLDQMKRHSGWADIRLTMSFRRTESPRTLRCHQVVSLPTAVASGFVRLTPRRTRSTWDDTALSS
jgi:hypothetical protein